MAIALADMSKVSLPRTRAKNSGCWLFEANTRMALGLSSLAVNKREFMSQVPVSIVEFAKVMVRLRTLFFERKSWALDRAAACPSASS
jgi:hypothetical protein